MKSNSITSTLLGVAVGDALGVPYEFKDRSALDKNPAKDMTGYGTHGQPAGTWSDDTSLTLCLADSLLNGYDLKDMAAKFIAWKLDEAWTARGEVFDIGNTTAIAIGRLRDIMGYKQKNWGVRFATSTRRLGKRIATVSSGREICSSSTNTNH